MGCMSPAALLACLHLAAGAPEASAIAQELRVLDGVWAFHAGDNASFAQLGLNDGDWRKIRVPTRFNRWGDRWQGLGWYRVHFDVATQYLSGDWMVSLGPARDAVEVYLNGSLIARRGLFGRSPRGGARIAPLVAWVPDTLLRDGDNVLAVRALDVTWDGALATGPVLFGTADKVLAQTRWTGWLAPAIRIILALLCFGVALAQLAMHVGRGIARDVWWLAGAGFALSVALLDGTGVLDATVPSLELATRLPLFASYLAVLALGSYFAMRYDDWGSRTVSVAQVVLASVAGLVLPAPDLVVAFVAQPLLVLAALGVTLYSANLLARAARRQEEGAIPVFVTLIALAGLVVHDGLVSTGVDILPPSTLMGGTAVLLVTVLVSARQAAQEHQRALVSSVRLRRQLENQANVGILAASVMSMTNLDRFFEVVIDEASRDLEVRRCSLVLLDEHGELRIRASVGLPRHATTSRIELNDQSVTGWVLTHGRPLTPASMPPSLSIGRRRTSYVTDAFVSQPIRVQGRAVGVLNVSDRNDGGGFSPMDEIAVEDVADKLAVVLAAVRPVSESSVPHVSGPRAGSDGDAIPELRPKSEMITSNDKPS